MSVRDGRWRAEKGTIPQRIAFVIAVPLFLSFAGCGSEPGSPSRAEELGAPSRIRFEEVTRAAGLSFHHFTAIRAALLPEDNGSGLAFGDYDNDGFDDLYIANLAGPVLMARSVLEATRDGGKLFHNEGDGTFSDVTEAAGVGHVGWDNGVLWADFDSDGWLDLLLTGIDKIVLLRNRGDGTFEDRSTVAGLGEVPCEAMGATAGDYDRDDDLDLYVPCYVDFPWQRARDRPLVGGRPATMTTPANYPPQANLLLRNDGTGRFEDVAESAGVADPEGRGLQATFIDLDGDGAQDLYVTNDQSFDRLFRNAGNGMFEDATISAGTRDPRAGMGIGLLDYDDNGKVDLFVTHWVGEQNALYRNVSDEAGLLFEDRTYEEGLGPLDAALVGWGTGFRDFDLDGVEDLVIVNGSTVEDEWTLDVLSEPKMIPQQPMIFTRFDGRYVDVSASSGAAFQTPIVGRGMSFSDFDRDGSVDIAIQVHNGEPLLLRNRSETGAGNWLGAQLVGDGKNRWAIGSKVTVRTRTEAGETRRHRAWRVIGEGYAGTHSATLHFGLGSVDRTAVEVTWPSGETSYFDSVPVDRVLVFIEASETWREQSAAPVVPRPWGSLTQPETGD